ncbi:MAG: DUF3426 domain-containing protein [Gammaproteobacteria bacterium]|nr:MAG: DUF3426 domain-containing protein [Gammaproteobacteria bacterium]
MQTRCPSCETIFRLEMEQLNIASGMVQCGVCGRFFNANTNLYATDSNDTNESGQKPVGFFRDSNREQSFGNGTMPRTLLESHEPVRPPSSPWATFAWSVLIVLTLLLALSQLAWFNINQLAQHKDFRPWVDEVCTKIPCDLEQARYLDKLELLSRDVRSHPTRKNALLITATFINRAEVPQPFPQVELVLSGLTGETVAMRRFTPREYLKGNYHDKILMPPGVPGSMVMEVIDPGDKSVSYRFDFM